MCDEPPPVPNGISISCDVAKVLMEALSYTVLTLIIKVGKSAIIIISTLSLKNTPAYIIIIVQDNYFITCKSHLEDYLYTALIGTVVG